MTRLEGKRSGIPREKLSGAPTDELSAPRCSDLSDGVRVGIAELPNISGATNEHSALSVRFPGGVGLGPGAASNGGLRSDDAALFGGRTEDAEASSARRDCLATPMLCDGKSLDMGEAAKASPETTVSD
mmetsp:Transcript_74081/g.240874  ORF Transcript_74081/g.240874 Transcript_74081/m.240874 type:complete len:129 (+) Transcript_74081:246-632(+)